LIEFAYKLDDKILKISHQHQYLGITLDKSMHWSHHIQALYKKANKFYTAKLEQMLFNKCIKASAYLTIISPLLEYTSCVWDPHQIYQIHDIEKIQRRAARWVISDYNLYSSVTEMLKLLEWPTLQTRRRISRISLFHKIVHHLTPAIQIPPYYLTTQYPTKLIRLQLDLVVNNIYKLFCRAGLIYVV